MFKFISTKYSNKNQENFYLNIRKDFHGFLTDIKIICF